MGIHKNNQEPPIEQPGDEPPPEQLPTETPPPEQQHAETPFYYFEVTLVGAYQV